MPPRKGWAAVYCRLSREDTDKLTAESESIRNQRALLTAWAEAHGYKVWHVYADEDYSGIDRARPGFNAMLADAEKGMFEVILAKTQSRFTRDMELVEKYLHGLFPLWGVRFIAVLDHVDTQDAAGKKARQIAGLINEWYLEDLSANVRAVLNQKRRDGCYIASFALYGYKKNLQNHNRLLIDTEAAGVVRDIFSLYLQGLGVGRIARSLNERGIPPPSVYRAMRENRPLPQPMPLWTKPTVRRILSTQTYTGATEQGRVRKLNYKSRKIVRLPREEWTVVPRTHEPIVSEAEFAAVQKRLQARRGAAVAENPPHTLAGRVYCGICGGKMELTGTRTRRYYRCRNALKSRAVCPGQSYLPMQTAEELVAAKAAAHARQPVTGVQLKALVRRVAVYPPCDGVRQIRIDWNF